MQFYRIIFILFLLVVFLGASGQGFQDSIFDSELVFEEINTLKKELELNKELMKIQSEKNDDIRERSGKFIDWTALLFTGFTILFLLVGIIAGVLGYREFSDIKKSNAQLKKLHSNMILELNEVKNLREELQDGIQKLKNNTEQIVDKLQTDIQQIKIKIEDDSKDFLRTIYLLNQGISDFKYGDLIKAGNSFIDVLKINKNDYTAKCYLARCYFGQKKIDLGIKTVNEAIELEPENSFAYKIRGEIYRRIGKYKESISSLKKANELQNRPAVLNSLGYSYLKDRQIEKAISVFKDALKVDRRSSTACGLAKAYLLKQKKEEAKKYFYESILFAEEELARNALYIWPYYNLAYSYMVLDKKEHCINILNEALSKDQNLEAMREQLTDYKMINNELVSQELLNQCILLIENRLKFIESNQIMS